MPPPALSDASSIPGARLGFKPARTTYNDLAQEEYVFKAGKLKL